MHRSTILRGGVRKFNQTLYKVKGFRLFDKVLYEGEEGFVFGRRSSGYFEIRTLEGVRITASENSKRVHLIEPKRTFLVQLKGAAKLPASEDAGFLADSL